MATEHLTIVKSDLSGDSKAATFTFGLGDTWYEIDLTEDEQKQLEGALQSYVKAGRKAVPKKADKPKLVPDTTPEQRDRIRAWARETGLEIPNYGRIPKEIVAAWNDAHPDQAVK